MAWWGTLHGGWLRGRWEREVEGGGGSDREKQQHSTANTPQREPESKVRMTAQAQCVRGARRRNDDGESSKSLRLALTKMLINIKS